jgi:hypothetical protein
MFNCLAIACIHSMYQILSYSLKHDYFKSMSLGMSESHMVSNHVANYIYIINSK